MDLQTFRDGDVLDVTAARVAELLSADRDFGGLATVMDGKGNFLQAVEAQRGARQTGERKWPDTSRDSREMFVLIWRKRRFRASRFCDTAIPKEQVVKVLTEYLAGGDSWQTIGRWISLSLD